MKNASARFNVGSCEICRLQLLLYLFLHFDTEVRRRGGGSDGESRQEEGILMKQPVNSCFILANANAVSQVKSS